LKNSNDQNVFAVTKTLTAIAPRLDASQVSTTWKLILEVFDKRTNADSLAPEADLLAALVSRIETAKVDAAWNSVGVSLKKSNGEKIGPVAKAWAALAPRLNAANVISKMELVIAAMDETNRRNRGLGSDSDLRGGLKSLHKLLVVLAQRLDNAHLIPAWNRLLVVQGVNSVDPVRLAAADALLALTPRLTSEQVAPCWNGLEVLLENSGDEVPGELIPNALIELAPRLELPRALSAWNALMAVLRKPPRSRADTDSDRSLLAGYVLAALVPRLDQSQVLPAWHAAFSVFQEGGDNREAALPVLIALAPRLEEVQRSRLLKPCVECFLELHEGVEQSEIEAVRKLFSFLEPATRDAVAITAIQTRLERETLGFAEGEENHVRVDQKRKELLMVLLAQALAPRSLAKLLSHPNCVGIPRERLLERFEELAFHEGRPVFFPKLSSNSDGQTEVSLPPRRFHSLSDAAAWIQQNWPDFDLETNCPVTWRGSR